MGVDIFFVISGFLITQIIIKESVEHRFTFRNFWARRIKRIMPALLVVLATTIAATLVISFRDTWGIIGLQSSSVLGLFANFAMWKMSGDYWGPQAEDLSLLHTWSLSLEEQFYILYPILLILFLRIRRYRSHIACLLVFSGYILCIYDTQSSAQAAFFQTSTRAWELGIGGLIALLGRPQKPSPMFSLVGFLLIIFSIFNIDESSGFPGYISLLPVAGAVLIIRFSDGIPSNLISVNIILRNRFITYIGRISYSLYLWHWPIIVIGREWQKINKNDNFLFLLLIPFLSVLTYHLIEQPARKSQRIVFAYILSGFLLISAASVYLAYFLPLPNAPSQYNATEWRGDAYDLNLNLPLPSKAMEIRMAGIDRVERNVFDPSIFSDGGIVKLYGGNVPDIVVFGSSHALMWAPIIDEIASELKVSISFQAANATAGYVPSPLGSETAMFMSTEEKFAFDKGRLESLQKWKPSILLISDVYSVGIIDKYRHFLSNPILTDIQIFFVEQPPFLDTGDVNIPRYVSWRHGVTVKGFGLMECKEISEGRDAL